MQVEAMLQQLQQLSWWVEWGVCAEARDVATLVCVGVHPVALAAGGAD